MSQSNTDGLEALGLSDLHQAVLMNRPRRVVSLLTSEDKQRFIEARDADGATPLMTAVLMGRLAIVKVLLQNHASTRAKDDRGRKAREYTKTRLFESKLAAYHRLGFHSESKQQRCGRLAIGKLLRHPTSLGSVRKLGGHKYSKSFLYKHRGRLMILQADKSFKIAKQGLERATTGFIVSATQPGVKFSAVSGWQPNKTRGVDVLDNTKYTQLVRDVAQLLGFQLGKSFRDRNGHAFPEDQGRFFASHVEKKLSIFWVIAALKATLDTTDYSRIAELKETTVPEGFKHARIFLDHDPCSDCLRFLHLIKSVTGIAILFERRPFLTKGSRKVGCEECHCARCLRIHHQPHSQRLDSGRAAATEDNNAEAESEADTGPDLGGVGDDENIADQTPQPREPRKETVRAPIRPTSGSRPWRTFISGQFGKYQKPVRRPLKERELAREVLESAVAKQVDGNHPQTPRPRPQAAPRANQVSTIAVPSGIGPTETSESSHIFSGEDTTDPFDPPSNLVGRFGFFATPDSNSRIEVQLPVMDPRRRAEFDRVSLSSRAHSNSRPPSPQAFRAVKRKTRIIEGRFQTCDRQSRL